MKTLQNSLLPRLLNLRTCIEVDEAMQEFASKCCQHNAAQPPATSCIMNADGVYLATYAALLLTLRQRRTDYYREPIVSRTLHLFELQSFLQFETTQIVTFLLGLLL